MDWTVALWRRRTRAAHLHRAPALAVLPMRPLRSTRVTRACLAIACVALLPATARANVSNSSEWRFNVSLDGKSIGYHRYAMRVRGDERELRSEAHFNVKFLFINAYTYAHTATEHWQGDCLARLDASTNDNGTKNHVTGTRNDAAFVVDTGAASAALPSCVQTFAYWNPEILMATQLLNPQTGEYVPIRVLRMGPETVTVRGRLLSSERYRLVSEPTATIPVQIDLWYASAPAENRQWLALESLAAGGRRLRYTLQ